MFDTPNRTREKNGIVMTASPATLSPATEPSIDIGDSQLGYRFVGPKNDGHAPFNDLVFVHGWPLHAETWRNVVKNLPNHRCHLIDLPGCGNSVTPAGTAVSLSSATDAVVRAVDALGLQRFTLVGHDSGGLIARFAAAKLADRVEAIILSGTEIPHHHPKLLERLQKAISLPGATAVTRQLLSWPWAARSNHLLGGLFHDRSLIEGDFRTRVLAPHLSNIGKLERQREILASYTTDLVDSVEQVQAGLTCPALFIWGENDPFFPMQLAREMADGFGGPTRFEVIGDARLLVHEEHPERFAELCVSFLDRR